MFVGGRVRSCLLASWKDLKSSGCAQLLMCGGHKYGFQLSRIELLTDMAVARWKPVSVKRTRKHLSVASPTTARVKCVVRVCSFPQFDTWCDVHRKPRTEYGRVSAKYCEWTERNPTPVATL